MDIVISQQYVADFDGTALQGTFDQLDGSTVVVQAYDRESGLICALAQAEGQPLSATEQEARYQLALHIHRNGAAAGDASDPRA